MSQLHCHFQTPVPVSWAQLDSEVISLFLCRNSAGRQFHLISCVSLPSDITVLTVSQCQKKLQCLILSSLFAIYGYVSSRYLIMAERRDICSSWFHGWVVEHEEQIIFRLGCTSHFKTVWVDFFCYYSTKCIPQATSHTQTISKVQCQSACSLSCSSSPSASQQHKPCFNPGQLFSAHSGHLHRIQMVCLTWGFMSKIPSLGKRIVCRGKFYLQISKANTVGCVELCSLQR